MADPIALDPELAVVFNRPFDQQVSFFRGKLGNLVPTQTWTDMLRGAHDRGFMVAGAQSADLLAGLAAAVDKSIAQGGSIDAFRKDFRDLVKREGWAFNGEANWRTRTIYTTNLATSYSAGRLAQLREGGFPYWVYVHSDSVLNPRPLHVSWNGLTLRADDPWWQEHYPPNGWGCRCRVVGVRKPESAARFGPVKTQAPSDGADPKTGAPAGIDAGWDYQPGATVVDTVRAMAAKTQQWDYVLAKAYMEGVPTGVRDALAVAYRTLPSVADDTRLYAQRILEARAGLDIPPYRTLGLVTSTDAAKLTSLTTQDVSNFDFAMDRYAPLHIAKQHGDVDAEQARGQRAVTAADYAVLPRVLNAPDVIEEGGDATRTRQSVVRYRKRIDGEEFVAVFEVRRGRRSLSLLTMYVIRRP